MVKRMDQLWRLFATAICFLCFGVGGLVLGFIVFPLMSLVLRDRQHCAALAKRVIHLAFRMFVQLMVRFGVLSYEVHGLERLRCGGLLILANHPSLVDVVFLMSFVERADCIVKATLARNSFVRGPVRAAGYVFNDSGVGLVDDCIQSMKSGNNLIIFPEGTRTPASGLLRLQRGAARVAIHGGIDITPVRIHCTPAFLKKGVKWYRVPPRPAHFRIEVCETIPVSSFLNASESPALAARRLTEHLTDFFLLEPRRALT
jgi:1-acyl-sn-glycerol-3-phosphate acyltransferase